MQALSYLLDVEVGSQFSYKIISAPALVSSLRNDSESSKYAYGYKMLSRLNMCTKHSGVDIIN